MNDKPNENLRNIQEIRNAVLDMKGISKSNKKTIFNYMACLVSNGFHIAQDEDAPELLDMALWNLIQAE
jgi:hypothetical protein